MCHITIIPDGFVISMLPATPPDIESAAVGSVLVFVNPHSGAGGSLKTFTERVEPQLKRNRIDYELIITKGPNHARSVVRSRDDLGKFNGVIILSGDGLVYEILNGLTERRDRTRIIPSLPIGIVPSGSGNGLLSSLFFNRGLWNCTFRFGGDEPSTYIHAARTSTVPIKGTAKYTLFPVRWPFCGHSSVMCEPLKNPKFTERAIDITCSPEAHAQPVNIIHVQTDNNNIAAFLSIGWGLMADIDIESERWRKSLGSNRFALGGLLRVLSHRAYRGRLSYKPHISEKRRAEDLYDIYGMTASQRMESCSSASEDADESSSSQRIGDATWRSMHSQRLVDLEEDVPEDWITIEDDFVSVYAVTLSHISRDGPYVPRAQLNDDRIYLTYILKRDVPNRLALLRFLVSIRSQKHLDMPFVKVVEVSAFRLEPLESRSYIVVDGEVVASTKIQAVTTTLKMAVFAP